MNIRLCLMHIDRMSACCGLALQEKAIGFVSSEDGIGPVGEGPPALDSGAAGSL